MYRIIKQAQFHLYSLLRRRQPTSPAKGKRVIENGYLNLRGGGRLENGDVLRFDITSNFDKVQMCFDDKYINFFH